MHRVNSSGSKSSRQTDSDLAFSHDSIMVLHCICCWLVLGAKPEYKPLKQFLKIRGVWNAFQNVIQLTVKSFVVQSSSHLNAKLTFLIKKTKKQNNKKKPNKKNTKQTLQSFQNPSLQHFSWSIQSKFWSCDMIQSRSFHLFPWWDSVTFYYFFLCC